MMVEIRALEPEDDRSGFQSGDAALDLHFHRYAGQNQFRHHVGVTYVAVEGSCIIGILTVSPASVDVEELPSGRRMPPYPIPVLRIARLAVDRRHEDRRLGQALLRFCIELAERMREELGCIGLVADVKSDAATYDERFGFESIEVIEGATLQRPAPAAMFLPLQAVPRRGGVREGVHRQPVAGQVQAASSDRPRTVAVGPTRQRPYSGQSESRAGGVGGGPLGAEDRRGFPSHASLNSS